MLNFKHTAMAVIVILGVALTGAGSAEAKECWRKGAIGEAGDVDGAKFQVDEALLQAVDWGAWAAWMASGGKSSTPGGYSFGPRVYSCKKEGSFGVTCRGAATICKL
jgi:hypothetical protein